MTQMTITLDLEDFAKPSDIKRIIKNIKGVAKVSSLSKSLSESKRKKEDREWLEMVNKLRNSVDYSNFDMKDKKTRYILKER